jgi:AraC-like DNA-binding protein/quercetin dioxygenase-like cupin family protein
MRRNGMTLIYRNEDWLESEDFPFFIAIYSFVENERIPPHAHEFIEFVYVLQGEGTHFYHGSEYPITRGDVFIIEPNAEHYYVTSTNCLKVYNVLFQPSLIAAELDTLNKFTSFVDFFYVEPFLRRKLEFQSHLVLDHKEHLDITFILDRLLNEFKEKRLGSHVLIKTQLIELFIFLSRFYENRTNKSLPSLTSNEEIIRQVCKFIELHHAQPLSLQQVSQLCGMSQSVFSNLFKQLLGQTFIDYRNELRINAAEELLRNSNDKIMTIAGKVGFEDLSFFNQLFKRRTGLSPREFRKTNDQHRQ